MNTNNYKKTKMACYTAYFTMASVFSLPPILFVTFRDLYGISYTLLGTLILTNFCTQLAIDLIFSIFSKRFNVQKVVRIMPLITSLGLLIYAFSPIIFKSNVYAGLLIGTVIFSVSAGLSEVLLSPIIAAIPSDNPNRDMSFLHSLYAFGVLTVVFVSTLFLKLFGNENWMYLTLFWATLPVLASILFCTSSIPNMNPSENAEGKKLKATSKRTVGIALCMACIFFGACAENVMSNWVSGYMESGLHIDKTIGDLLGMALFAVLLGVTRIAYSKYGKHIGTVLLIGMIGAAICYLTVSFTQNTVITLAACVLTGMFTAMLWPGTLLLMEENIPSVGVAAYALMAAGGDLGASVAPQLMGIVVDKVSASSAAIELGTRFNLSSEQIGMKAGMAFSSIFPIFGAVLLIVTIRYFRKRFRNHNSKVTL